MHGHLAAVVTRDPDILGGVPVFAGTRVPVKTLFDYIGRGLSLGEFLDDFPTVQPDQAQRVVALLGDLLTEDDQPLPA